MFIMVHDLELSVSGQVYLGETWALTIRLQWCSEDREVLLLRLNRLRVYKIVTSVRLTELENISLALPQSH